jgi:hypothetical protein
MVMGYRMTWMFVEDPRRRVGAQGVRRRKCKTEIHARGAISFFPCSFSLGLIRVHVFFVFLSLD